MSSIFRYDSDLSGAFAVKARPARRERIRRCLAIQKAAAAAGIPCAEPVTAAGLLGTGVVVSAETWLPGGEMETGDDDSFPRRSASLLARLASVLESHSPAGLEPPPPWLHWNPPGGAVWPPNPLVDSLDQRLVPGELHSIARAASARIGQSRLPAVVGHGDWESQNLRWRGSHPWAIHDWDSLVALPEAAIVGAASGAFASTTVPTLASVEASAKFIECYQAARGRAFSAEERGVAWAASLWPALHNARGEMLFRSRPVAFAALMQQASERLARAGTGGRAGLDSSQNSSGAAWQ